MSGAEGATSAEAEWGPAADVAVVRDAKDDEESISSYVSDQVADVHVLNSTKTPRSIPNDMSIIP
tara:strand:+ start:553 stop:747 length:195 start_codon:yes stop_codon:yes gene_type:complete